MKAGTEKKKTFAFLKQLKIKQQLYLIYLAAVFLPITIIGGFLLINTSGLLTNYHRDLLESDNLRVKTILFEITTQIYNISEELAFDKSVREIISGNDDTPEELIQKADNMAIVDNYSNNYAEIESVEIYTDNPAFIDYKEFHKADDEIKGTDWYQRAKNQSSVFWVPMMSEDKYGNEYWNLCLVRKIPVMDSSYSGVLVIKVSDNYLKTRINSQEYTSMVSVDQGPVVYSSDRALYGTNQNVSIDYEENYYRYTGNKEINGKICFVDVSTLHMYQSDSKVYICTVNEQAYGDITNIVYICLLIIGVAVVLPGIVIHFFTNYFTSRILILREAMHRVSNEDYEINESLQGQDEVSEAFSDLEVMVQKIQKKDADMYEARINEQELVNRQQAMEFKMLSSQINPHFLYNTLETIRMKAFTAGDKEVATAIKLLGKSMRYVLENTGTAFTTLNKELEHIKIYLAIQELRFGNKFDSSFEIAEDVNPDAIYILPLLLQPVVENAILHGLEEKETGGYVKIVVHRQQDALLGEEVFCIDVTDNGQGMEEAELHALRNSINIKDISRSRSIGLYNINQRMKICYGTGYGMQIDSKLGSGTTVRLLMPAERSMQIPSAEQDKKLP